MQYIVPYAKPKLCDTQTVVKYISRYLGRPVIALNRIDSYDGENVTFHYNRHEENAFVKKTIPALDFISLLIQHIPEPHYKMTRYYGLYARHRSSDNKLRKAIHPSKHKFICSFSKWRNNISSSFGYDPLCCSKCKATMTLTDLYFKHQRVSLEGMTAKLVKNMSDSDLLDMHYFLTEDDDWDGDELEKGFYINLFQ